MSALRGYSNGAGTLHAAEVVAELHDRIVDVGRALAAGGPEDPHGVDVSVSTSGSPEPPD
jgi:hypothetical protein